MPGAYLGKTCVARLHRTRGATVPRGSLALRLGTRCGSCPDETAPAPGHARGMIATKLIRPPRAPSPPEPSSVVREDARPAESAEPTLGETLDETVPLIGAIPVYGPPVVLVAGPWLLLALMLAGPFALLVTLVVLLAAAATLVGVIGGILSTPYLLVRHHRRCRAGHASMRATSAPLVAGGSR